MTPRPLSVLVVGLVVAAVAGAAAAMPNAPSGKVTVTGDNGDYVVTFENTGAAPITCWRWTLGQGALVTAASRVDGWQLGLNQPAPAPIIGGKALAGGIPPGGKQSFRILTNKPFDSNGSPGTAQISEDCVSDGPAPIEFGSPPKPQPEPKPQPKPCVCKDLKTRIVANRSSVTRSNAQGFAMELLIEWNLTCTKGAGTCTGQLTLVPSARGKRLGIVVTAPPAAVTCKGPCAKTTKRFQKVVVSGGARWAEGKRGRTDKLVRLVMKRTCKSTRIPQTFDIVFARNGGIDGRLSDLNANGITDGKD